jgi:pyridoxamine 5'-phosphate oxidase
MSSVDPRSRQSQTKTILHKSGLDADPVRQFQRWFADASAANVVQPEAMTLATVGPSGQPSARIVLLRDLDQRGFVFFTSYKGRKARELEHNPLAALVFFWEPLERQVRVEGKVERVSAEESEAYFAGRPRGSQLGAWASPQSEVLANREELKRRLEEIEAQYMKLVKVPRPPDWGGYRVVPTMMEFWQGQPSRLHDRIRYTLLPDGKWLMERLAP